MNTDMTFCLPANKDQQLCINCIRRVSHRENETIVKDRVLSMTTFTPRKSNAHGWHCDGEIRK